MPGWHAGGKEARERRMRANMGHAGELGVEEAQTVAHHGFDGLAGGHKPQCRRVRRCLLHNLRAAEVCKHSRAQPQMS
jgi:hypothetical protein